MQRSETDQLWIGSTWKSSARSAGEIALTVATFYNKLLGIDQRFNEMAVVGDQGRKRTRLSGDPNTDAEAILLSMSRPGDAYHDRSGILAEFGPEVYREAGFTVGIYPLDQNSVFSESYDISISAGSFGPGALQGSASIALPQSFGLEASDLDLYRKLLKCIVSTWSPDLAFLTSFDFMDMTKDDTTGFHIGWINYIRNIYHSVNLDVFSICEEEDGVWFQLVEFPSKDIENDCKLSVSARNKLRVF